MSSLPTGAGTNMEKVFDSFPILTLKELERQYLQYVLNKKKGNMMATAALLKIPRATFYRLVARYGLVREKK